MKEFELKNGMKVPAIGLGTYQLEGEQAVKSVEAALNSGYRHIDTAQAYGNHKEVAKGIKNSDVPREEILITTKVWRSNLGKDSVISSVEQSLQELNTDYIDLLLIHWPNKDIPLNETLEAFAQIKDQGKIKAIGVSNFNIKYLEEALNTGVEIVNNQVEIHPSLQQKELRKFCAEKGILVTAYSPVAQGEDLKLSEINEIAQRHNKTSAQVIINWIVTSGMNAIPRSTNPDHIWQNFNSLDFDLDEQDMEKINSLDKNNRIIKPFFADF